MSLDVYCTWVHNLLTTQTPLTPRSRHSGPASAEMLVNPNALPPSEAQKKKARPNKRTFEQARAQTPARIHAATKNTCSA